MIDVYTVVVPKQRGGIESGLSNDKKIMPSGHEDRIARMV